MGNSKSALYGQKKVIIVGASTGIHAAKSLATAGFDVTVIDRNAVYYHRVGALRAIVDKSFDPYIPLDKIDGKFIHGSVVSIDEAKKVVIVQEKGCAVSTSHSYDYLILSPGSTHSGAGMQMTGESQAEHQSLLANIREELHQVRKAGTSKQVLIVGGGPVGVEMAGELLACFPGIKVALAHSGSKLIDGPYNGEGLSDGFKDNVAALFQDNPYGTAKLLLNKRADFQAQEFQRNFSQKYPGVFVANNADTGAEVMFSDASKESNVGVVLQYTGMSPNTAFLDKALLDAKGFIQVKPTLQLVNSDCVFAIGDAANVKGASKTAYIGGEQAKHVAKSICQLVDGNTSISAFVPEGGTMFVTFGKDSGAAKLGCCLCGACCVTSIKSGDMMMGMLKANWNQ